MDLSKTFLYLGTRQKIFSVPFFSSSEIHQSQYLNGCQAMGKSSSFIEAF